MGAKILLVDDEVDVLEALEKALRYAGHDVSMAKSAREALRLSQAHPFDLAILDYMMPEMSGIEILNRVRADHPTIRAIVISGKLEAGADEGSVLTEINASIEADRYLHKPVDVAKLKNVVNETLSKPGPKGWKEFADARLDSVKSATHVKAAERALKARKKRMK